MKFLALRTIPLLVLALASSAGGIAGPAGTDLAPEFTHSAAGEWINARPQALATLRGKPVLVEFWTFDCINCRRTLPWLQAMQRRYKDLVIVSVHTPELRHERDPKNVQKAVVELGITYPVMLDTDFSYWNAMGNRYWPAFYLIDRQGRVSATEIGELHEGQPRAVRFERHIERALAVK